MQNAGINQKPKNKQVKNNFYQTQNRCHKAEVSTETVHNTFKKNTANPWWTLNTAGSATAASATPTQVTAGLTHSSQITKHDVQPCWLRKEKENLCEGIGTLYLKLWDCDGLNWKIR